MVFREKLVPRSLWSFPTLRFPFSLVEEEERNWPENWSGVSDLSGLSIFEDEQHIYVEAALPGITPDEVEMTFDKGVLWIKGEKKEQAEDKQKKYYRKAVSSFSYRLAVPGEIDENKEPEAVCKNGVLKVSFSKTKKAEPKKISIKGS